MSKSIELKSKQDHSQSRYDQVQRSSAKRTGTPARTIENPVFRSMDLKSMGMKESFPGNQNPMERQSLAPQQANLEVVL